MAPYARLCLRFINFVPFAPLHAPQNLPRPKPIIKREVEREVFFAGPRAAFYKTSCDVGFGSLVPRAVISL